jgi:hypothetical protein
MVASSLLWLGNSCRNGDREHAANFRFAEESRFILREERTFLRPV